jgi:phosphoribosylformylglycinamidine cyclo-ligase
LRPSDPFPGTGRTVAEELLRVHRSYLTSLLPLVRDGSVHALAHITGGGIAENLERVIPAALSARIDTNAWPGPPEFSALMESGPVERSEMFATFNMGIGMIALVREANAAAVRQRLQQSGEEVFTIGRVEAGDPRVVLS